MTIRELTKYFGPDSLDLELVVNFEGAVFDIGVKRVKLHKDSIEMYVCKGEGCKLCLRGSTIIEALEIS